MSATLTTPFAIGDTLYHPGRGSRQVTIPCPVCAGKLAIVVELGSGERVGVPCDGCGHGFEGPRGTITEWVWEPAVRPFVIDEIVSFSQHDGWRVKDPTGDVCDFNDLFTSEFEAFAASTEACRRQHESNMQSRQHKRGNVQRQGWSIQYHRQQIKDLERQIAWHRSKVIALEACK